MKTWHQYVVNRDILPVWSCQYYWYDKPSVCSYIVNRKKDNMTVSKTPCLVYSLHPQDWYRDLSSLASVTTLRSRLKILKNRDQYFDKILKWKWNLISKQEWLKSILSSEYSWNWANIKDRQHFPGTDIPTWLLLEALT